MVNRMKIDKRNYRYIVATEFGRCESVGSDFELKIIDRERGREKQVVLHIPVFMLRLIARDAKDALEKRARAHREYADWLEKDITKC